LERFNVLSYPTFDAELQRVRALYVGENIAPVIVLLNKITLRKTGSESLAVLGVNASHGYVRHGVDLRATSQSASTRLNAEIASFNVFGLKVCVQFACSAYSSFGCSRQRTGVSRLENRR